MRLPRATFFVFGGVSWIASALVLGSVLLHYIAQGAGVQFFPFLSSGSVLMGLIHVIGFFIAAFLCFVIGIGICAHGLVPPSPRIQKEKAVSDQFHVKFGEIGRTVNYSDVEGHIEFTFDVGSTGTISLSVMKHPCGPFDSDRHKIATLRTKQYLQSQGFWVEAAN